MSIIEANRVIEPRSVVVREPREAIAPVPLLRVTKVELRKMFDTRSGFWLMASIVISAVLATVGVVLFAPADDLTYSTFNLAIRFPVAVILPLIAILSVTSEWSQRSGLTTFTLVPHRSRVILAKAISAVTVGVVSMLVALSVGALGHLASAATGTALVWDVSLTECLYFLLGNVLSLLIGFMLGVLIRSSSGAIAAYLVYSFLFPRSSASWPPARTGSVTCSPGSTSRSPTARSSSSTVPSPARSGRTSA